MFNIGDKVRKKNGTRFSNDEYEVTVEKVLENQIWFKETQSYLNPELIEVVGTTQKPPLGVMPRYIWEEKRFRELQRAITDYTNAHLPVKQEWIEEYNELQGRIFEG